MPIGSVIYVCHYIFPHLFDDLTETSEFFQGQSSVGQSLLCTNNVPHLTPSRGCTCPPLTSLPPDRPQTLLEGVASAQADLQRYCILKLNLLRSTGPSQGFSLGFLSFRGKYVLQLDLYHTLIQHASLRSELSLFLYLFKIW